MNTECRAHASNGAGSVWFGLGPRIWMVVLCLVMGGQMMPASGHAASAAGRMKTVDGTVRILRGEEIIPASPGVPIYPADRIQTSGEGTASLFLSDNTAITIGPESTMRVGDYLFEPQQGRFQCILRFMKGTFGYLSGMMAKLAPDRVQIHTPDATIGIRGTRLLIKVK